MTTSTPAAPEVDDDDLDFRQGGQQALDAKKADDAARKASWGGKTEYLTAILKKDGDTAVIRFLYDQQFWIEVMEHNYVNTKAAPKDKPSDRNWPDHYGAVCRKTLKANEQPFFDECFICDIARRPDGKDKGKPFSRARRMWAVAVVREPVLGTAEMVAAKKIEEWQVGTIVGYKDATVDYEEMKDGKATGQKLRKKRYVWVNYGIDNFFQQFIEWAKPNAYGTVVDRDFTITRSGEGKDTVYPATPMDKISLPVLNDEGAVTGTAVFDLRNPKFMERYADAPTLKDLRVLVKKKMSKEHYDRFFDTRVEVSWKSGEDDEEGGETTPSATAEPAAGTPDAEKLASMRDRIVNKGSGQEQAPAEPEAAVDAPAEPEAPAQPTPPAEAPVTAPAAATAQLVDWT